jgi:hypothetical protein
VVLKIDYAVDIDIGQVVKVGVNTIAAVNINATGERCATVTVVTELHNLPTHKAANSVK